jgi:hypothetical protein
MIPANETSLSELNWKNGSLDSNLGNEWSRAGNSSQPVNLTILADGIAAIQFLVQDQGASYENFDAKFALVRTILSANYYSGSVSCVFPISGSYDLLPRILFYTLLLFALLYRRHTWVAVAALGTAMTYSATTAVHAFALLTQYDWTTGNGRSNMQSAKAFGDLDLHATLPILLTASVVFAPIFNWSKNVRREKAQIVMVLWGTLCFAALVPVTVYVFRATRNTSARHGWNPNFIEALMLCPRTVAEINPVCSSSMHVTLDNYTACQCFDFCGLLAPTAPMRSGTLVALLPRQILFDTASKEAYAVFFGFIVLASIFITCYGALALVHSYFSLREMRNLIFRLLCTPPRDAKSIWNLGRNKGNTPRAVDWTRKDVNTSYHKARFMFAKSIATSYYLLGVLVAVSCPVISVAVIFNLELTLMNGFTYSEGSDSVGAWSPWVGATFVLLVAVILQYQDRWEAFLLRCGERLLLILGFHGLTQTGASQEKDHSDQGFSFAQFGSHLLRCSIGGAYSSVKHTWLEFRDWRKAPAPHSPICSCEGCILYRKLARATSTIRDHADNCPCNDCEFFKEEISSTAKKHNTTCGCRLCQSARDQTQSERRDADRHSCSNCARMYEDLNKAEPIPAGYRTLGMRILRSFDRRLTDMLEDSDTRSAMVPLAPMQRADTTTTIPLVPLQKVHTGASLVSLRSSTSSPASSIDSQEPRMT